MRMWNGLRRRRRRDAGFTITELVVALTTGAGAVGVAGVACSGVRADARAADEEIRLRGTLQGLVLYSQNNRDDFPLPSKVDRQNATVRAKEPTTKDTTSNIFSILIWQGFIPTEILISPAEVNPNIKDFRGYVFDEPPTAARPAFAAWDPAFNADFMRDDVPGGMSYAHMLPSGKRWKYWNNTRDGAWPPVLASRGPKIDRVVYRSDGSALGIPADPQSNTIRMWAPEGQWSGCIAGRMGLWSMAPRDGLYTTTEGERLGDVLFYDEPWDAEGENAYLSIFVEAGREPADFKAIWD